LRILNNAIELQKGRVPEVIQKPPGEGVWKGGDIAHVISSIDTRSVRIVSFASWRLYPRPKSPVLHCIGGWVRPRSSLEAVEKKISLACAIN
jgi:hypothetical protein